MAIAIIGIAEKNVTVKIYVLPRITPHTLGVIPEIGGKVVIRHIRIRRITPKHNNTR